MTTKNQFVSARVRNLLLAILLPIILVLVGAQSVASTSEASGRVPALIVNNDEMVEQINKDGSTTQVVAGRLLVSWLTNPDNAGQYDWQLANPETAQQRLDEGSAYVVVTIPKDFSESVVSASTGDPKPAKVEMVTSQAHDYRTGEVTQQIFDGMIAEFGQDITNQIAVGLADGVNESADGLQQAANGAGKLADGAGKLGNGFDQYADGTAQLADGAGQSADGAGRLAGGARDLDSGARQYVDGVEQYVDGASQLAGGVDRYVGGVNEYVGGVKQYVDGVKQLDGGLQQLAGGADQLRDASGRIDSVADRLDGISGSVDRVREQLGQVEGVLDRLSELDASELYGICERITDPDLQAECTVSVDTLIAQLQTGSFNPGDVRQFLDEADQALAQLSDAGPQLKQLSGGLNQFADGVTQAADGSSQLASNGDRLVSGGNQLTDGGSELQGGANRLSSGGQQLSGAGGQLVDGTSQLADGTGELSSGLNQLAHGAQQLDENSGQIKDGIGQLHDGAGKMQSSLQDGADQARSAISDTDRFAEMVSQPVQSTSTVTHNPGFGGILAAMLVPVGAWVAGFVTAIRRRMLTDDLLDSSVSNMGILIAGIRRVFTPVMIVALALTALAHLVMDVPAQAIGGTLLFALLAGFASSALHLMFAVFWARRNAAIVSLSVLLLQLLTLRGVIPFEWRAPWVGSVSMFLPVGQTSTGLQAIYAGGNAATVVAAAAGLILVTLAALAITAVAIGSRRKAKVTALVTEPKSGIAARLKA